MFGVLLCCAIVCACATLCRYQYVSFSHWLSTFKVLSKLDVFDAPVSPVLECLVVVDDVVVVVVVVFLLLLLFIIIILFGFFA